jgi:hypothetical protein
MIIKLRPAMQGKFVKNFTMIQIPTSAAPITPAESPI